MNYKIVA